VVGVVRVVARVVKTITSMVRAVADVDMVDADRICASSMEVVVKLLMPVVQVI
jgi:hypothetical protein